MQRSSIRLFDLNLISSLKGLSAIDFRVWGTYRWMPARHNKSIMFHTRRLFSNFNNSSTVIREEMEDVVGSVFDLVGRTSDPILEEEVINERVNRIFQVRLNFFPSINLWLVFNSPIMCKLSRTSTHQLFHGHSCGSVRELIIIKNEKSSAPGGIRTHLDIGWYSTLSQTFSRGALTLGSNPCELFSDSTQSKAFTRKKF